MPNDLEEETGVVLGIDSGSTKTRFLFMTLDGKVISESVFEESLNLYTAREERLAGGCGLGQPLYPNFPRLAHCEIIDRMDRMLLAAIGRARIDNGHHPVELVAACIGTAGIDGPNDLEAHHAAFSRNIVLQSLGDRLVTMSDVEIIAGCSEAAVRVCVIAGTGSNIMGLRYDGERLVAKHQVGGLDLDLSDSGSAACIGHRALRSALLQAQCQSIYADDIMLGQDLFTELGIEFPNGWRALRGIRQQISKDKLAGLARIVASCADRGDKVSISLLEDAGVVLAYYTGAALIQISALPDESEVLLVGGVWKNPIVQDMFSHMLSSWTKTRDLPIRKVDPAMGAAHIALKLAR